MDNSSYNVETEKSKQNINTNNNDIINTMLKCYELHKKNENVFDYLPVDPIASSPSRSQETARLYPLRDFLHCVGTLEKK